VGKTPATGTGKLSSPSLVAKKADLKAGKASDPFVTGRRLRRFKRGGPVLGFRWGRGVDELYTYDGEIRNMTGVRLW